ncbi:hypothetical protein HGRIS_014281 [Hohenbuehelia grisea]|uniref:RING-type domain-containing protein n=1 Tax=Hohenbuehelia grisea TaxID=104357 RepID=A0ABR3JSW5_9AGAR
MLSLGPGSACDVCLEPFDHGAHAPHSIRCGHVFCVGCLCHLSPCVCPLCRTHFDELSIVKLHLDLDNVQLVQHVPGPVTVSAEQDARRLQEAIANVANQGASEQHLRQLIDDCRSFLAAQSRSAFQDLRVSHRMLAYMCDIRSKLKAEKQVTEGLHKQVAELSKEKKDLEEQYETLLATSSSEKEAALDVEMALRDHCERAEMAYQYMADRVSFLPKDLCIWAETLLLVQVCCGRVGSNQ